MQRVKTSLIAALASMGALIGISGASSRGVPVVAHSHSGGHLTSRNGGRKIGAGVAHQKRIAAKARNKARK